MNLNRLAGIMLLVLGLLVGVIVAIMLFADEELTAPARLLGLAIALVVVVAPLVGGGLYLLAFGSKQAIQQQQAQQQRRLLDLVQSRGEIEVNEMAVEMQLPVDQIKDMLHGLVGLGIFSGYINWNKGVLYSSEASQLRDLEQCPNCGGEITLSGKGIATCRFCDTEFYLS